MSEENRRKYDGGVRALSEATRALIEAQLLNFDQLGARSDPVAIAAERGHVNVAIERTRDVLQLLTKRRDELSSALVEAGE